jgi:hypothetical protein
LGCWDPCLILRGKFNDVSADDESSLVGHYDVASPCAAQGIRREPAPGIRPARPAAVLSTAQPGRLPRSRYARHPRARKRPRHLRSSIRGIGFEPWGNQSIARYQSRLKASLCLIDRVVHPVLANSRHLEVSLCRPSPHPMELREVSYPSQSSPSPK